MPSVVQRTTFAVDEFVTPHIITTPLSLVTGNHLVYILSNKSGTAPTGDAIAAPAGWNQSSPTMYGNATSTMYVQAFWREIDGTETTTYTFTTDEVTTMEGCLWEVSGADDIAPFFDIDGSQTAGGATSHTISELTSLDTVEKLILAVIGFEDGSVTGSTVSLGFGNAQNANSYNASFGSAIASFEKTLASGGDSGDCVVTSTGSTQATWLMLSITGTGDSESPNIDTPTQTSSGPTMTQHGFDTDEDNGSARTIIVADGDESLPTRDEVIDGGAPEELFGSDTLTISTTGTKQTSEISGLTPGTTYGFVTVHRDAASNSDAGSRIEGTFTTPAAYTGSATHLGATIPANSVAWQYSGQHTAATSATVLTDSSKSFPVSGLVGLRVNNPSDNGSSDTIDSNTAQTATVSALTGGTDNDFDQFDVYNITWNMVSGDVFYYDPDTTVSSGQCEVMVYTLSSGVYSPTVTITFTATGAPDGPGTISMDANGVLTFTPSVGGVLSHNDSTLEHKSTDLIHNDLDWLHNDISYKHKA